MRLTSRIRRSLRESESNWTEFELLAGGETVFCAVYPTSWLYPGRIGIEVYLKLKNARKSEMVKDSKFDTRNATKEEIRTRAKELATQWLDTNFDKLGAKFQKTGLQPSTITVIADLLRTEYGRRWSGKLYRVGSVPTANPHMAGTFFHTQKAGASFYGSPVKAYPCPEGPCFLIDIEKLEPLCREFQVTADEDPAITVERLAERLFQSGVQTIVVNGETGAGVDGDPVEVILRR